MGYLARPGELLKDHLKLVGTELEKFGKTDAEKNYYYLLGISHDFGKYTQIFQKKLQESINGIKYKGEDRILIDNYSDHSQLGAVFFLYLANKNKEKIKVSNFRKLLMIGFISILKHHGDFPDFKNCFDEEKLKKIITKQIDYIDNKIEKEINELLAEKNLVGININDFKNWIKKDIGNIIKNFANQNEKAFNLTLDCDSEQLGNNIKEKVDFILAKKIFANLLYADKYKSIFGSQKKEEKFTIPSDIIDNYRNQKGFNKSSSSFNKLRNDFYEEVNKNLEKISFEKHFLILNGPTGIGKTLNLLNIGIKLYNKIGKGKIIYALPFTSIIDQTEQVLEDVLKDNFKKLVFKHHHLSGFEEKTDENYDEFKFLLNAWDKPIILTTFWQLFHSFYHNKNKLNIKFANWENAIFILDEVQSLPYEYWDFVGKTMEILAKQFNCYFVLSSATLPKFIDKKHTYNLCGSYKKYFSQINRTQINLSYFNQNTQLEQLKEIVLPYCKEKKVLITLNTIKSSVDFFNLLKENISENKIAYLSTNIIPKHRKERIKQIKNGEKQILVSTQLIEAGVDIDFDIGFRDFAPIDSIIQIVGRLNRNNKKEKGELYLLKLVNQNNQEYYRYIYKFMPTNISKVLFKNTKIIEEKDYLKLFEEYFKNLLEKKSNNESIKLLNNRNNLCFKTLSKNFHLIDQKYETIDVFVNIDDESEKIRNDYEKIKKEENIFDRRRKWDKIKKDFLNYTIQVSVENAIKVGLLTENSIKEYKERIIPIDKSQLSTYYDNQTGFKYEVDNFI